MTVVIPQMLLGKHTTQVTVAPVTVNVTTGVVTVGSPADLAVLGTLDECSIEPETELAEVSPINAGMKNYAVTKDDFTITVGEKLPSTGLSTLEAIWIAYNYYRVAFKWTNGTDIFYFSAICVRQSIRRTEVQESEGVVLTGKPAGIAPYWGATAPSF